MASGLTLKELYGNLATQKPAGGVNALSSIANTIAQKLAAQNPSAQTPSQAVQATGNAAGGAIQQARAAQQQQIIQATTPASAQYNPITTAQDAYANRGTPYTDIAKAYEQAARANFANQQETLSKQLAASKKSTNAEYDAAASGNYVNYMKQQNALPEQLAQQGIRGGASETAMAQMANNYALNQGNTAASRVAALGALQNAYDTNLANLRQALEENVMNNNMTLAQAQAQYEDALAQRAAEEIRYNADVERAIRERTEDRNREQTWRNEDYAREDARYAAESEKEQRWRDEDIAREEKYRQQDQKIADADKKYERSQAELQYKDNQKAKMLEEYAAGLAKYTKVETLEKMADKIKKTKGWAKDPFLYGKVQAINARIGEIRAAKNK